MSTLSRIVCKCQTFRRLCHDQRVILSVKLGKYSSIKYTEDKKSLPAVINMNKRQQYHSRSGMVLPISTMSLFATVLAAEQDSERAEHEAEKETKSQNHKDEVIMIIKRGKLAEQNKQFEEAEQYYHQALDLLAESSNRGMWSKDDLLQARIYVYDCMANLALFTYQFDKAEGLYKETMRGLLQQGYSQTDNAIVELSLKLAMIYSMIGKDGDAQHGYDFCIKTQEDKIDSMEKLKQHVDENTIGILGLALDSYSKFLIGRSLLPEALESVQKALDIAEKVFGLLHSQVAVLYNDKATVQTMLKEYGAAKDSVVKAIYVAKKTDSSDLPVFIANLGAICIHNNELTQAETHCERAVKLSQKLSNQEAEAQAKTCLTEVRTLLQEQKVDGNK